VFWYVWGPIPALSGRNNYYVSFSDDYRKFTWIYLLRNKSDVFHIFHDFQHHVKWIFGKKNIVWQTDWGGG
jgi:histone deacetylase 1/2